jgi:hypothetical protein
VHPLSPHDEICRVRKVHHSGLRRVALSTEQTAGCEWICGDDAQYIGRSCRGGTRVRHSGRQRHHRRREAALTARALSGGSKLGAGMYGDALSCWPRREREFCGPITDGSDRADYEMARDYLARQIANLASNQIVTPDQGRTCAVAGGGVRRGATKNI